MQKKLGKSLKSKDFMAKTKIPAQYFETHFIYSLTGSTSSTNSTGSTGSTCPTPSPASSTFTASISWNHIVFSGIEL